MRLRRLPCSMSLWVPSASARHTAGHSAAAISASLKNLASMSATVSPGPRPSVVVSASSAGSMPPA